MIIIQHCSGTPSELFKDLQSSLKSSRRITEVQNSIMYQLMLMQGMLICIIYSNLHEGGNQTINLTLWYMGSWLLTDFLCQCFKGYWLNSCSTHASECTCSACINIYTPAACIDWFAYNTHTFTEFTVKPCSWLGYRTGWHKTHCVCVCVCSALAVSAVWGFSGDRNVDN